jgi:hypothetical protein
MCDITPYIAAIRDPVIMVSGALISGLVGFCVTKIQRRKEAEAAFLITVFELDDMSKVGDFHTRSCASIRLGLARIKPFSKPKVYAECGGILRDYKKIPEAEMNRQSQESLAYRMNHHIEPEERFSSYVKRFEKALA